MLLRGILAAGALIAAGLIAVCFNPGPASAADAVAGKKKAAATCAACHGIDGIAKLPEAPHLAAEQATYIIKQLKAFKSGERKHEQMSIIAGSLSDEDMADIAAWYAKIKVTGDDAGIAEQPRLRVYQPFINARNSGAWLPGNYGWRRRSC